MTTPISRDLGHGVRVMPGDGGGIVVLSANLDLGWRPREDDRPGSAVMWEGSGFEVVEREPWRRGARWILEPWRGEDVMRVVLPLDSATVATAAQAAQKAIRAAELRPLLWIGSPILGFASASRQRRWRDDYGFPATLATSISAIGEIVVGTLCVIEIVVSMFADEPLFPWIPRMLVPLGLVVFIEGAFRLAQIASDPRPVGSLFGLPFTIFDRRESPPRSKIEGRSFADQRGVVETVLLSIAATLAPRRFQERWAGEIRVRPFWFTLMGASAELVGGLANLGAPGDQPALKVLINLFFCGEAIVRFSSLVFRGRPLGSVLGLPLAAILERYLPEGGRSV